MYRNMALKNFWKATTKEGLLEKTVVFWSCPS